MTSGGALKSASTTTGKVTTIQNWFRREQDEEVDGELTASWPQEMEPSCSLTHSSLWDPLLAASLPWTAPVRVLRGSLSFRPSWQMTSSSVMLFWARSNNTNSLIGGALWENPASCVSRSCVPSGGGTPERVEGGSPAWKAIERTLPSNCELSNQGRLHLTLHLSGTWRKALNCQYKDGCFTMLSASSLQYYSKYKAKTHTHQRGTGLLI